MEKPRPSIEEATGEDEDKQPERSRGFLSQLLDRLRSSEQDEDESDDSGEKLRGRQSKRWQKFFGKLFKQVVEPVSPLAQPKESAEPGPVAPNISNPDTSPKAGENVTEQATTAEVSEGFESPRESLTDLEAPKEAPRDTADYDTPPDLETAVAAEYAGGALGAAPPEAVVYQRVGAGAASPEAGRLETIIERGGRGLALVTGLLGAEFLARRRADRKIRQDLKKLREEAKTAAQAASIAEAKRLSKLEAVSQRVAPLEKARKAESKLPAAVVSREAGASEPARTEKRKPSAAETVPSIEKKETTLPRIDRIKQAIAVESLYLEQVPAAGNAKEAIIDKRPGETALSSGEIASDNILETVAAAADKDIPLEKLYERRHEVKDVPTKTAGAASVSTILSRMGSETAGVYSAIGQSSDGKINPSPPSQAPSQSQNIYAQAMKNGFLAALVLLVFIVVAAALLN